MANASISPSIIQKSCLMLQTNDGRIVPLNSNSMRKNLSSCPAGYRRVTKKPCSECGNTGAYKHAHGISYALFKGRKEDWLCVHCAKSQNII